MVDCHHMSRHAVTCSLYVMPRRACVHARARGGTKGDERKRERQNQKWNVRVVKRERMRQREMQQTIESHRAV